MIIDKTNIPITTLPTTVIYQQYFAEVYQIYVGYHVAIDFDMLLTNISISLLIY